MEERIKRLNDNGYKVIHIFGCFYLIRRYGYSYKWSLYDFRILR